MEICQAIHALRVFLQYGNLLQHEVFEHLQRRNCHRLPCLISNGGGLFGCSVSWERMAIATFLGWTGYIGCWCIWLRLLRRTISNPRIPCLRLANTIYFNYCIGNGKLKYFNNGFRNMTALENDSTILCLHTKR